MQLRILTLLGIGEQNINSGTISALFTTIGDQVQLNLPKRWSLMIHHGYNTLAQNLNLYWPRMLAQAPLASPAVASCNYAATASARSTLTNAMRLGGTSVAPKKRRLTIELGSNSKHPRNDKNSINSIAQKLGSGSLGAGNLKQDDLDEDKMIVMPPLSPETYLTNKQNQARVALLQDILDTFPE